MTTDAQKRAQQKYDRDNRGKFKVMTLKFNKEQDADVLEKLSSVPNMQGYIKELIRKDIKGGNQAGIYIHF